MTEWEKMISGVLYDPTDPAIAARARHCRELLYDFNHSRENASSLLSGLFGRTGDHFFVETGFHCDYGCNISVVAGIVGGIGNDLLSEYNTFKLGHLLNGLASGFNLERRLNELYNYVNSSPEKAIIVANLFKQTVNAECPKVCVIYGLILANHLETLTEFTHEELIVCKALENATDYDLKNFKEIMENYLKPTSNGRRIVFPKDFADIAAFTTTCDWCVYNRIFVSRTAEWGEMEEGILDMSTYYYEANPASVLLDNINAARQTWNYG